MQVRKEQWIELGYKLFAISGPNSLKIEVLAKMMGISKSSFYHHFAEMDIFIEYLMQYHLEQSKVIAQKEHGAERIVPDLLHILIDHSSDLLFNKQLRVHQHIPLYHRTLQASNDIIGNGFITLWIKDIDLRLTKKQVEGLFTLALENFFLQINSDTLNEQWLTSYFESLKRIAKSFE